MSFDRRHFMISAGAGGLVLAVGCSPSGRASAAPEHYEINLTPDQWRKRLTPGQYNILRDAGTEPPFTSPLNKEHRSGIFSCAGCALPLFSSKTKYDSGTGWPSFWTPLAKAVKTETDYSFGFVRTEVHCRRCGGHLGHVFDDGPPPTGKRYCMNGLAMKFTPGAA